MVKIFFSVINVRKNIDVVKLRICNFFIGFMLLFFLCLVFEIKFGIFLELRIFNFVILISKLVIVRFIRGK